VKRAQRRVEARLISLPVRESLSAAHDDAPPQHRELVIFRVETVDGVGWGECSALNRPTYTSEFARGVLAALMDATSEVGPVATPMLWSGWQAAVLDEQLRSTNRSLAQHLGSSNRAKAVASGVALGIAPLPVLEARARTLQREGYRRIKIKIQPGHDAEAIRVVQHAAPQMQLQVDANGSYSPEDLEHVAALASSGIQAFEQPFAPAAVEASAALVHRLRGGAVAVVGDESVANLADAQRLARAGAITAVSVKAARVGGVERAAELVRWCSENGVDATAGGMLESGLGRHQLVALAAMPGMTVTGDVSPANRWLAEDPWPDVTMKHDDMGFADIEVPGTPGIAPEPDADLLDRFTLDVAEIHDHPALR